MLIIHQLALTLRRLISPLRLPHRIQMVGKLTELSDHDFVEAAQRILGLAEHLRNRRFARKPLILFVQTQLRTNQGNQVFSVAPIENRKARLKTDSPAIAPE